MERTYTSMLRRSRQQIQYASNSENYKEQLVVRKGRYPNLEMQCTKKRKQSPDSNPEPYYVSLECQDETDGTLAGLMQISTTPTSSIECVYTPYDWGINPVINDVKTYPVTSSPKYQPQKKIKSSSISGQGSPVLTPSRLHVELPSYPQPTKSAVQSDTFRSSCDKKSSDVTDHALRNSTISSTGYVMRQHNLNRSPILNSCICPSGDQTIPSEGSFTPPWRPHHTPVSPVLNPVPNISIEPSSRSRIHNIRNNNRTPSLQENKTKKDTNKMRMIDICESSSLTVRRALATSKILASDTSQLNRKPDIPGLRISKDYNINNITRSDKYSTETTASFRGRESWTHRNVQQLVKGLSCPKTSSSGLINRITQDSNRMDYTDSNFKSPRTRIIPLGTPTPEGWKKLEKLTPEQIEKGGSKLRLSRLFGKSATALKMRGVSWNCKGKTIDT